MTPIVLDPIDQADTWALVRWLSEQSHDWVLIGGLMVATFDLEHGHQWRATDDIDSLYDIRGNQPGGIRGFVERLRQAGFAFVPNNRALGHRLTRDDLILDVLSAEHFPEDPVINLSPRLETFQTPGGSQALKRRELIDVSYRGDKFRLPRPNLLGAIVLKAAASAQANRPKDHRDFAHLVAKVDDPYTLAEQLKPSERRQLANRLNNRDVRGQLALIDNATTKLQALITT